MGIENNTRKRKAATEGRADVNIPIEFQSPQIVPLTDKLKIVGKLSDNETQVLQEELFDAVQNNKPDKLRFVLRFRDYININTPDKNGWPALIKAAWGGDTNLCKILAENGADLNIRDSKGMTALMWAVNNRYASICEILAENKADVNIRNNEGQTVLMLAAWGGSAETVEYLLSIGANPLLRDKNGKTAYERTKKKKIKQMLKEHAEKWRLAGGKNIVHIPPPASQKPRPRENP